MYIKGNIILVCVMDKRTTKKLTHTHKKKTPIDLIEQKDHPRKTKKKNLPDSLIYECLIIKQNNKLLICRKEKVTAGQLMTKSNEQNIEQKTDIIKAKF